MGLALTVALALFPLPGAAQNGGYVARVGVLSPERGSLRSMAAARKYWIDIAFKGNETVLGDSPIRIELLYADTRSQESDDFCANSARDLVAKGAVILLGPVRSGCVKSVLDAGLEIPVITTLASATDLTQLGNKWFFRASINDLRRLRTLWFEVQKRHESSDAESGHVGSIALHEPSKYGRGLATDLEEVARPDPITVEELPAELTPTGAAALLDRLMGADSGQQYDLFLLGSATEPAIMATLVALRDLVYTGKGIHAIYTVGDSSDLLTLSPMGVTVVGEPALGPVYSNSLRREVDQRRQQAPPGLDFYPTTYQIARFVVPEAIKLASQKVKDLSDLPALREAIREQLESFSFSSLQPPLQVSFVGGEMEPLFDLPVYEITAEYRRLNSTPPSPAWIEYPDGELNLNFLEAPLKVRVVGHQTQTGTVELTLYQEDDDTGALVSTGQSRKLTLADGDSSTETFHLRSPGRYSVRSNVQSYPADFAARVSFSPFYVVCIVAALLAVMLKHRFAEISWPMRIELLVEGVVSALAVAFISTYIQYSLLPISPLDWNLINGLLYGFVGGWFGPALITQWSSRVVPSRSTGSK